MYIHVGSVLIIIDVSKLDLAFSLIRKTFDLASLFTPLDVPFDVSSRVCQCLALASRFCLNWVRIDKDATEVRNFLYEPNVPSAFLFLLTLS